MRKIFKFVNRYMVYATDVQSQSTTEYFLFDSRRYNLPTTSQVAAVFISDDDAPRENLTLLCTQKVLEH